MAGDWIKVENCTPDKAEVFRISELTGLSPDAVVGKLVSLWIWADEQTTDGNAPTVTKTTIDYVVRHAGFAVAMQQAGWLVDTGSLISIPNFDRHNGETAKQRALTAKRVAKHKKQGNAEGNGELTPTPLPREEKRRDTDTDTDTDTEWRAIFRKVSAETLRDTDRLLRWHAWAVEVGDPSVEDSDASRLRILAIAERALEKGENPVAMFASVIGGRKWRNATPKYRELANLRLAKLKETARVE